MIKKIGVTQRIVQSKYGELRTQIDIKLLEFISICGYQPIIIPYFRVNKKANSTNNLLKWILKIKLSGIVLSGGDDIGKYALRDKSEILLIKYSLKKKIPIFGICRGMQIISKYFKINLKKVRNHVGQYHYIYNTHKNKKKFKVNSFHNFSINKCPKNFVIEFLSSDGNIESIKSKSKKIYACMWHPERYKKFRIQDIKSFKNLFK